jgi:uncharacterized protein
MEHVTYSLKLDKPSSQFYYKEASIFTDEVLQKAEPSLTAIVNDYLKYISRYKLEEIRAREEYILELLSFGILWQTYSNYALNVKFAPFITLSKMGEWRKKHQRVKSLIDFSRGVLTTLLLMPEKNTKIYSSIPTLDQIDRVCIWFEATGEFREEALRFIRWRAYWGTRNNGRLEEIFTAIADFTGWFIQRSTEVLGKFTENVDRFVNGKKDFYRWREDRISCTRTRAEYHLNMVGADLMNRSFRRDYNNTTSTAVLLPGCMRIHTGDKCEAIREARGLKCIGCEASCPVNQLRVMGQKKNFDVYVIPHASDLSLWAPKEGEPRCGIIASACVTTLVGGGWELKRYGVPAQCVLLDYSGCKKHWHPEGIRTGLNKQELERILDKDANSNSITSPSNKND